MELLVLIKQVPDTKDVKLDPATNTMRREGVASIINPYDLYAVEAALKIRDQVGGTVTALSMGPPQAEQALRQVVEYGVDQVFLLSDRAFAGSDTWATSYTLAKGVQRIGRFDLIVCGKQAIDGDTAQVGPELAEHLGLPYVCFVRRLVEVDSLSGRILVERMMDDGYDLVEAPLPALITVVKEIGEIRVPSLKGKMKAKKMTVPVLGLSDLDADPSRVGLSGSPTQVVQVFSPEPRASRIMIEGPPADQVNRLLGLLTRDKILAGGKA